MTNPFSAWLAGCLPLLLASAISGAPGPPQDIPPARAVIDQYCVGCHNDKLKTGGLSLDTLDVTRAGEHPDVWEKVVRKLRGRMMPPPGRPRPDERGYDALVSYLETSLDRAAAANPDPGRTETFRRLNRTEYQNAIRDLLALDVDVASLLPKDDASYGFDNVSVGGLSPTLLERYLTAAQKISRLAMGSPVRTPGADVVLVPPDLTQEDHIEGLPFGTRGGTIVHYTFPVDAQYEIQIRLMRDRNENIEGLTEPHQMELTLDGDRVEVFSVTPKRASQEAQYYTDAEADGHLKVRMAVKAGPHDIGATFIKKGSALLETAQQPYQAHFNYYRHPRVQPAVYSVSVTGPFDATGVSDTPSRRRIFVCRPAKTSDEERCATNIISTLARRAYRRPVTNDDIRVPLGFYKDARAEGDFEAGIEMALRAILTSTEFIFRIERDPENVRGPAIAQSERPPLGARSATNERAVYRNGLAGGPDAKEDIAADRPYRIDDLELASRLSFFLWSSIPDDELLDVAAQGKLHEAGMLERQVRRMLADSRSQSLVTNFAGQWLYLRNLPTVTPDGRQFPDFDDNLRQAFRRETELFFESIVKEDRSVIDLLNANYTFLNERLAKYYDIPNVYGSNFRRVTLPKDSIRGGLLGQGSILTVTSYANRTSPVLRGKWVLENILGTPPPPPPPNVPPLTEDNPVGKVLTMRERMAQHRTNPACSSCHQLMDPIGLSFEHFDATGRWRNRSEGDIPIDAAGALPSGVTFEGVKGLKQALLSRPELFITTATEKMLTYALGRGMDYYDAPAIRAITREARNNDYRFSSLILGVVKSAPFQMRRSK
jgi:mono/diheme cytochrome c family protein